MADKELMIAPASLKVIAAQVEAASRPPEVSQIEGIAASAAIVEGDGTIIMSIWPEGATESHAIMLDHDELIALMDHLKDLHDLICPGADQTVQ